MLTQSTSRYLIEGEQVQTENVIYQIICLINYINYSLINCKIGIWIIAK